MCVPTLRLDVEYVAEPDTSVTALPTFVPSIANWTLPVGELPVTVAVNVTESPKVDGFAEDPTAVLLVT